MHAEFALRDHLGSPEEAAVHLLRRLLAFDLALQASVVVVCMPRSAWMSSVCALHYRHLGNAGEAAVHLLSRMLAFDPARRCSAEEALAHEYLHSFEAIVLQMGGS